MKTKVAIYLAGNIKKGHEVTHESFWTEEDRQLIRDNLPDYDVVFLNPAQRTDNLSDQKSVFGRDMLQVFSSHFVFVDARERRGLGVGAEMMWAKVNRIPVVTWAPKDTNYHMCQTTILGVCVENYVHPFVEDLSDKIAVNLIEAAKFVDAVMKDPNIAIKDINDVSGVMQYYKDTQLNFDGPMKELIQSCKTLQKRTERNHPLVNC
jgi:hypothetical protein